MDKAPTRTWLLSKDDSDAGYGPIAAELGCTRQRVAQIERIALKKARKELQRRGIELHHFLDALPRC